MQVVCSEMQVVCSEMLVCIFLKLAPYLVQLIPLTVMQSTQLKKESLVSINTLSITKH